MNKLATAVIIDPNQEEQNNLCSQIKLLSLPLSVSGCACSLSHGKELINKFHPDIIIIEPGIENGFDFLKSLDKNKYSVMVITQWGDKNKWAKITNLKIDFILKPFDTVQIVMRLGEVITECIRRKYSKAYIKEQQLAPYFIQNHEIGKKRIMPFEIVYIESDGNYLHYWLTNQKRIVVTKTMKKCEEELHDLGFYRVQNSFIVNILHIGSVKSKEKHILTEYFPDIKIPGGRDADLWKACIKAWEQLF